MNRTWVGVLFLAFAGLMEAQISVGTSAPLVSGYVGTTYCFVQVSPGNYACPSLAIRVAGSGGTAPYAYSISGGALPPGMTLRTDGTFNGILGLAPSATGTYTFTVRATDSLGASGTGTFSITVLPSFVANVITATVGVPFTRTGTCGAGSTYTSSGLPPGLTRNATTGAVSGTPTTAGAYTATFSCTATSGAVLTVLEPFVVSGRMSAAPASLSLTGIVNGGISKSIVQVGVSVPGQAFTATSNAPWLTITTLSPAPGTITAMANPAGLTAGTLSGTISVSAPGATPATLSIPVTYKVLATAPPVLVTNPGYLDFTATRGTANITKTVVLSNAGSGSIGPLSFQVVGINSPELVSRLTVTPSSGTVTATTPLRLTVTLNTNLTANFLTGQIVGSSAAGPQVTIPVTVQVTLPRFRLSQTAVFMGAFGDAPGLVRQPLSKYIYVYPDSPLSVRVGIQLSGLFQGSPWLTVTPATSPIGPFVAVGQAGTTLTLVPNPAGLSLADHYGVLLVSAPPTQPNPPVQDPQQTESTTVVFRIVPANGPGGFFPNYDKAIVFTPSERGPIALPLVTIDTTPLPLTISVEYKEGQQFMTVSPTATTTVAGAPATITLTTLPGLISGLPDLPNIVSADLVIQPGTLAPVRVPVIYIKRLVNAPDAIGRNAAATCVPTTLVPVRRSPLQNFTATVGLPTDIDVTVADDCGAFDSAKSVTASFSNGDAPVELTFIGNGRFTGQWSGRTPSDSVAVTITAVSADQAVTGTTEIGGTLEANPNQPPMIANGGVLNGASFALGGPLSPGSFVSVFGEKLATATVSAPSVPLPYTLAGSAMQIGGKDTPVFYASDGQVNAIIPYGISTDGPATVLAARDGIFAPLQSIPMVPAAPGIFQYGDRQGIVVGPNMLDLANSAHPVSAGQTIVVYCTGLGEVDGAVTAGSPTPSDRLYKSVNTVTMRIGGVAARVDFAGLTPGSTGLYQVNAVVPAGVAAGDRVPVVLTAAGQVSAPAFISVR